MIGRFLPTGAQAATYYNLPYRLRQAPGDVLVVGAGTGNDVQAALRHNARTVTAVEIDPAILYLGKRLLRSLNLASTAADAGLWQWVSSPLTDQTFDLALRVRSRDRLRWVGT